MRSPILLTIMAASLVTMTGCGVTWGGEPPPNAAATAAPPATASLATPNASTSAPAVPPVLSAVDVVKRVSPSVVTVVNEQRTGDLASAQTQEAGRGTGFIIDGQGPIVTNWHVVNGGDQFEVILPRGEKRPAKLTGSDQLSDLAVVQVDGPVPAMVGFGDSDALAPGQPVLAIGSPLGEFTNTVTDGIVSVLGRNLPGGAPGEPAYGNLIQHDAPINPGNSGGPLFDYAGEVVGVNTLGIPGIPGANIPVQGLFFAIPSNTVKRITSQLIENGRVAYPYLGVRVLEITPELASLYDLPVDHGASVVSVEPNGPAAQAGIKEGDIILALGDTQIGQQTTFTGALFDERPGTPIEVTVRRGDRELKLTVTPVERPQP